MAHKIRSLHKGSPKPAEIDVVGVYDELSPAWKLGSLDPTVPEWSPAIFGERKHHPAESVHRPRHDLKHTP